MKLLILFGTLLSQMVMAGTLNSLPGEIYEGQEFIDLKPSGKTCRLEIKEQYLVPPRGRHCMEIVVKVTYSTDHHLHPNKDLRMDARITNKHRPEYPAITTCATATDGATYRDDIYGEDTTDLYNEIFMWDWFENKVRTNFFVTYSPLTKLPFKTRLYLQQPRLERLYDCRNFQKVK